MAKLISRKNSETIPVFDITVQGTHTFFVSAPDIDSAVVASNCHQLSPQGLDGLLKPMEENIPGTSNKKLVCLFCTTEPESMKATVASRCAPLFKIRPAPPALIAERLAWVCQQEGITYNLETLTLIAEYTESHIRDSLKAVEGIALLGEINWENASSYLGLGRNQKYLDILEAIDTDLPKAIDLVWSLQNEIPPSIAYQKLSEAAMMAFRLSVGPSDTPTFWDKTRLHALGDNLKFRLLQYVELLAKRPAKPTFPMLVCDVATLNYRLTAPVQSQIASPARQYENLVGKVEVAQQSLLQKKEVEVEKRQGGGVYVDPRAVAPTGAKPPVQIQNALVSPDTMSNDDFSVMLRAFFTEQTSGQTG